MKKLFAYPIIIVLMFCLFPCQPVFAQKGYVSDMLLLTFRQGPGKNYEVLKTLKSNDAVTILEEQDGYYKVELASKEVGWVDKKFIIFDAPKIYIIQQLKREKSNLENKLKNSEAKYVSLSEKMSASSDVKLKKIKSLETSLNSAVSEKKKTASALADYKKKYDTLIQQSRDIQKIVADNKRLTKENTQLSSEISVLKETHGNLLRTAYIKWFLAGVGTLLTGWIFGQLIASRKGRRSSLLD